MNNLKPIARIASIVLTVSVAVLSFIRIDFISLLGKTVCFSVAATAPEGISSLFKTDNPQPKPPAVSGTVTDVQTPNTNDTPIEETVSVAVTETVIGNIIKKTLTPYTANTSFQNVFINNKTSASIDIASELEKPLSFEVTKSSEPQILIYHTHATESFMEDESQYLKNTDEPRSDDTNVNVVKIGEIITDRLESAGYAVVHDKALHDGPSYSGSYSRSAESVKAYLNKYPSIKIVIDIHRDSITSGKSDKVAPVVRVNGKEAAQVMLVMGSQTGSVSDYPNWRENLRLAIKLQSALEADYPQLARSLLLRSSKYNQNLSTGSVLIEVGSDANTLEQAKYSAELVAQSLIKLLEST